MSSEQKTQGPSLPQSERGPQAASDSGLTFPGVREEGSASPSTQPEWRRAWEVGWQVEREDLGLGAVWQEKREEKAERGFPGTGEGVF